MGFFIKSKDLLWKVCKCIDEAAVTSFEYLFIKLPRRWSPHLQQNIGLFIIRCNLHSTASSMTLRNCHVFLRCHRMQRGFALYNPMFLCIWLLPLGTCGYSFIFLRCYLCTHVKYRYGRRSHICGQCCSVFIHLFMLIFFTLELYSNRQSITELSPDQLANINFHFIG